MLNRILITIAQWLLISALLAAPFAIAQHQLDHLDQIQTAEHCQLCLHGNALDDADVEPIHFELPTQCFPAVADKHSSRTITTNNGGFLTRAPPLS